jgi:hypothetical protein
MEALVCVVNHANKQYKANCLGWGNVISSAHNLLSCRDLDRFASLFNDGYDAIQGEYYLYKHWQSSFVGRPTYIRIRNWVEGHKEDEESNNKAGVVATIPKADASTSLHITSGLHTSSGYNSVRKRHLGTTNLRYVRAQLFFIALCLSLAYKKCV